MIEAARSWIVAVAAASLLVSAARSLIPEGPIAKLAGLVGGLALLLTVTGPLLKAGDLDLELDYGHYAAQIQQRQAALEMESGEAMAELIAEKTQAYILDKATSLGLEGTVRVTTEPGPEGLPIPAGAEWTGPASPALAEYMEQTLGIPRERQVWHGTQ